MKQMQRDSAAVAFAACLAECKRLAIGAHAFQQAVTRQMHCQVQTMHLAEHRQRKQSTYLRLSQRLLPHVLPVAML